MRAAISSNEKHYKNSYFFNNLNKTPDPDKFPSKTLKI